MMMYMVYLYIVFKTYKYKKVTLVLAGEFDDLIGMDHSICSLRKCDEYCGMPGGRDLQLL